MAYFNCDKFSVKCKEITKESEIRAMTVIMKGKERDLELANQLREAFMKRYANNEREFQELIESLGEQTLDRLIHRLKVEKHINQYKDYIALKEIASEVKRTSTRRVFEVMSQVDDARVWINDNGKYMGMAFEALYSVFKQHEKLKPLIEEKEELKEAK